MAWLHLSVHFRCVLLLSVTRCRTWNDWNRKWGFEQCFVELVTKFQCEFNLDGKRQKLFESWRHPLCDSTGDTIFVCVSLCARWHYLCTTDVWTLRVNMCKYLSSLALSVAFNHPALLYARQPPSMGLRLCNVCAVNVHRARETRFVFWLPFVHWISYFSSFFLINYSHLHV